MNDFGKLREVRPKEGSRHEYRWIEQWIKDYKETDYSGRFETNQKIEIFRRAKELGILKNP